MTETCLRSVGNKPQYIQSALTIRLETEQRCFGIWQSKVVYTIHVAGLSVPPAIQSLGASDIDFIDRQYYYMHKYTNDITWRILRVLNVYI